MGFADSRSFVPALASLAFALAAADAQAFCRTTTCDPRQERCASRDGCIMQGAPLVWPDRCVSFGTQEDGSKRRHVTYAEADAAFRAAFQHWVAADCGGGQRPSFQVWDLGDVYGGIVCKEPEFNRSSPNANVWMFRDEDWPYENEDATLAMTTVQFEKSTGVILDADVEVNSYSAEITTTEQRGQIVADLQSISTHEAGHFLGLSHTPITDATMYARYSPGNLDIRTLHPDDVKGICTAYPPDRQTPPCNSPHPPHGFSKYCSGEADEEPVGIRGCSVEPGGGEGGAAGTAAGAAAWLALALGAAIRRRRLARTPAARY